MSASTALARPRPIAAERFDAFSILKSGRLCRQPGMDSSSLEETLEALTAVSMRGDQIMVRHVSPTGEALLRFYVIRAKTPQWMTIDGQAQRVSKRYAEHLFDLVPEGLA